jgi:uncharacterized oxidoreductase
MRLPQYLDGLALGHINGTAQLAFLLDRGVSVSLDANWMLGPAAGAAAAALAAERTRQHGLALVVARHMAHAGRIGAYTETMARRGIVALAFCNSPKHGHFVAPPGGRRGRVSSNPIAFAFPTGGEVVSADFATSAMPEGVIRLLRDRGQQAPEGTLLDGEGRATTDPNTFYAEPPGTALPLGGTLMGHKGFALGLMVEVLAGTLAGDAIEDSALKGNNLALIGIDPVATPAGDGFVRLAEELVAYVKSSEPVQAGVDVLVPGEKEQRQRALRRRSGIPIDDFTWGAIAERAARVGYELPPAAGVEASGATKRVVSHE